MPTVTITDNGGTGGTNTRLFELNQADPTTPYGSSDFARVKLGVGTNEELTMVVFPGVTSAVPGGATINSATLRVYKRDSNDNSTYAIEARLLRRQPVYDQATWNSYSTGNAWTAGGGKDGTNDRVSTVSDSSNSLNGVGYIEFDVTSDVQAMISGSAAGRGWQLVKATDGARTTLSSEGDTDGQRPELVVVYSSGTAVTGTGALTAPDSTISGSGSVNAAPSAVTGTGAPAATKSTVAASGIRGLKDTPGAIDLTVGTPTLSGTAVRRLPGTGALAVTKSTLAGVGTSGLRGSGALTVSAATIAATGSSGVRGTGALTVQTPVVSGGQGARAIVGEGSLAPPIATIVGTGGRRVTGTGALTAADSTLSGTGTVALGPQAHTGTGALTVNKAAVAGTNIPATLGGLGTGLGTLALGLGHGIR
jgi:hypothetical protein